MGGLASILGGGAKSLRALNDWYKTNMIDRY